MNSFNFLKVSFTLSDVLSSFHYPFFILKNDKHLISPHNIPPESHIKVTKTKEMIANWRSSLSTLGKLYKKVWRICKLIKGCREFKKKKNLQTKPLKLNQV